MFYQAHRQLCDKAQDHFRKEDEQIWIAQYVYMHSTDQGDLIVISLLKCVRIFAVHNHPSSFYVQMIEQIVVRIKIVGQLMGLVI